MLLSKRQMKQLQRIAALAGDLLAEASQSDTDATKAPAKRTRRSGKELEVFRKMLKAERKKGTPVADLAKTHGVSTAYIYQL